MSDVLRIRSSLLSGDITLNELIKAIVSEEDPSRTSQALLILQDQLDFFVDTDDDLCLILRALSTIYDRIIHSTKSTTHVNIRHSLQNQVLLTWTTAILVTNRLASQEWKDSFLILFDELIQIILNGNNVESCVLRSVACDCVLEIELAYPCLLSSMLETLRDIYVQETTYVYKKYAVLFATAVKHNFTQQIEPFSETEQVVSIIINRSSNVQTLLTSPLLNELEEKQVVSRLMEYLTLTSPHMLCSVIQNIAEIIRKSKSVPFMILRSFVLRYQHSYDISLLHTICHLQHIFGNQLFTEVDEQQLLIHIFHLARLPVLPTAQRLLFLDWLHYYIAEEQDCGRTKLDSSFALKFCPTTFDGWETILKKCVLMTTLLNHKENRHDSQQILWQTLTCIYDVANTKMSRKSVVAVFRMLFVYLKHYATPIYSEVTQFICQFFKEHSIFVYHLVDFVNQVQQEDICSHFVEVVWISLVQLIIQLFAQNSVDFLINCFIVLEKAVKSSASSKNAQEILRFLDAIITSSVVFETSSWILGNEILQLCQNLICYQPIDTFFKKLSHVLYVLFTKYNDTDIQDGARLLYMILMSASKEKISTMFLTEKVSIHPQSPAVPSMDNGEPVFEVASRSVNLVDAPFEVIKPAKQFANVSDNDENIDVSKNTLKPYRIFIGENDFRPEVQINFVLQFRKDVPHFKKIYCIDIKFQAPDFLGEIKNILVPHLRESQIHTVSVKFVPNECLPTSLNLSATFSSANSSTFACNLPSIPIHFEDFFLPLPVPDNFKKVKHQWRSLLFDDLWTSFSKSAQTSSNGCQESVHLILSSEDDVREQIRYKLQEYLIRDDSDKTQKRIGIFLSPTNHILLKMELSADQTIVRIIVDQWKILGLLNNFLLSLE